MSEPITNTQPVATQPQAAADARRVRGSGTLMLAAVVAIFGGGLLLTGLTSDVSKVSEPGVRLVDGHPFLVEKVGDWTGSELRGLTESEKELLPPDTEGARRFYKNEAGDEAYCSVILAGREVTSIHRPELCLPGQGWKIQGENVQHIAVPGAPGGTLGVMRMNMTRAVPLADGQTAQYRAIFAYWFIGKDCVTPLHWQRIFWTARDRVLHNTNHRWAYVMVSVNIAGDPLREDDTKLSENAMKVIAKFVQDIYPTLIETKGG